MGAQWLSGRVLDSRPRGSGFEPHQRHCVVSLSKTHLSLLRLVLVQSRKTGPYITERLLMDVKNQIIQTNNNPDLHFDNLTPYHYNYIDAD